MAVVAEHFAENPLEWREPLADGRAGRDHLPTPAVGAITRAAFLSHIDVCVRYLAAQLDGQGCVPIQHDTENATTAEVARVQLWQWLHADSMRLDDGRRIDFALFDDAIQRIGERLPRRGLPGNSRVTQAARLLAELTHSRTLADSLEAAACLHLP